MKYLKTLNEFIKINQEKSCQLSWTRERDKLICTRHRCYQCVFGKHLPKPNTIENVLRIINE